MLSCLSTFLIVRHKRKSQKISTNCSIAHFNFRSVLISSWCRVFPYLTNSCCRLANELGSARTTMTLALPRPHAGSAGHTAASDKVPGGPRVVNYYLGIFGGVYNLTNKLWDHSMQSPLMPAAEADEVIYFVRGWCVFISLAKHSARSTIIFLIHSIIFILKFRNLHSSTYVVVW